MKVSDLHFDLPPELIAQKPPDLYGKSRDNARLLVINRKKKEIEYAFFHNLGDYLNPGDTLVLNDTKVFKSVLYGWLDDKSRTCVVVYHPEGNDIWQCSISYTSNVREGSKITFDTTEITAKVLNRQQEKGLWRIKFFYNGDFYKLLNEYGFPEIGPYVSPLPSLEDYQTVYAKNFGSTETPSAGRHFTNALLNNLKDQGIKIAYVTLHIGFAGITVKEDTFEEHKMFEERFEISPSASRLVNKTKDENGNIIAVGTTSIRVLETAGNENGHVKAMKGSTSLYIYSGYKWKVVDSIITNFHPPKSTRIALVAAFLGKDLLLRAYNEAINRCYKFYEYGDATLCI